MSLYSKTAKIDGIVFGLVMRGVSNGRYVIVFGRECATLEQIEAIHWERPAVEREAILPRDYGYEVDSISYESCTRSYKVTVRVGRQYLGDATAYQDTIAALGSELAQADEALIALCEQQAGASETGPAETEEGEVQA